MDQNFFIQPWLNQKEFIDTYHTLFTSYVNTENMPIDDFINNLNIDNLNKGYRRLIVWESRNDNKAFVLSSLLAIDIVIKIKKGQFDNCSSSIDSHHILGEVIIRITNLIIDELKKTKKTSNQNMFLVAKEIDLPSFIIEIRHSCTHKNLPMFPCLLLAVKYLLKWIKENMWDKMYNIYQKEEKYYQNILKAFDEMTIEQIECDAKMEVNHIMDIIEKMFIMYCKSVQYERNKVIKKKEKEYSFLKDIYQILENKEKEFFILLIFQFCIQQLETIYNNDKDKYKEERELLYAFISFISKNKSLHSIDTKSYELLIQITQYKISQLLSKDKSNNILNSSFLSFFPIQKHKEDDDDSSILLSINNPLFTLGSFDTTTNQPITEEVSHSEEMETDPKEYYNTLIL